MPSPADTASGRPPPRVHLRPEHALRPQPAAPADGARPRCLLRRVRVLKGGAARARPRTVGTVYEARAKGFGLRRPMCGADPAPSGRPLP
ncbi:hypothetical protein NGM37_49270, partial [Streptomyces sp. TRM76130]|nr:hypothetical protein [Streptomyces sp. TRM76130]